MVIQLPCDAENINLIQYALLQFTQAKHFPFHTHKIIK